ncbi:MAG: class I SAM-dependent methyltransferase [Endomicrobiales bacterium]
MDERQKAIEGVFDRASGLYDTVGPAIFSHFGRRLAELADIPEGARVLDVATGRGAVLFPAAEAAGPQGLVIGIDLSGAMVSGTSNEIARRSLRNADALRMCAEDLHFTDELFDRVLCGFGLFFCTDAERALREMRRVMKPRAELALSTWAKDPESCQWMQDLAAKYLPSGEGANSAPLFLPPCFDTPSDIKQRLGAAGFEKIEVRAEERDFFYSSEDEWWFALWSNGIRAALEAVEKHAGSPALLTLKAEAFEKLREFKCPEGIRQHMKALFTTAVRP